jgi:hypothetical protein
VDRSYQTSTGDATVYVKGEGSSVKLHIVLTTMAARGEAIG